MSQPLYLVVMGVTGCGKSTVAARLAARLGWPMVEGDQFHSAANLAKMAGGVPLDDGDREPWLRQIAAAVEAWRVAGTPGVITCSALRRRYRAMIAAGKDDVWFVYLRGSREVIAARLAERRGHFMPASLHDSQLATLEEPTPPERVISVELALPAEALLEAILQEVAVLRDQKEF